MGLTTTIKRWMVFNAVGAGGVVVQLGLLTLMIDVVHLHYLVATTCAVEAALLHNFLWHQRWTWRDRPAGSVQAAISRFVRFHVLNGAISLTGNLAITALLTSVSRLDPVLANVVAIVICALANFAASESLVFQPDDRRAIPLIGRQGSGGRQGREAGNVQALS